MPTMLRVRRPRPAMAHDLPRPFTLREGVRTGPSLRRRKARAAVIVGLLATLFAFVGLVVVQDYLVPEIRDPEYGRRVSRWHARIAEFPDRPVVMVLGSSRVSMGVRPAAWEEVRPEGSDTPLLLNMAGVGSGPLGQLMFLRRILAEGPKPDAIMIEYWPPFLRGDGRFAEQHRIDPLRLGPQDRAFVQDYYAEPEKTFEAMRAARRHPYFAHRYRLLAQINPRFLKWTQRIDVAWDKLDAWGWLPGVVDDPQGSGNRLLRIEQCRPFYRDQFEGFCISPNVDRAYEELFALARTHGIRVGLFFMPESAEFRAWYPPEVERATQEHLAKLIRETGVPFIDARTRMPNDSTCDGFHLFRGAATSFTQQFGQDVMAIFLDLKRRGDP